MNTVLIFSEGEWGVSFTGSNPEPDDYVACKSYEDAVRLCTILERRTKRIAELHTQLASRQEPVAWRFTQNRGSGKTEYTYHDNTVENNHKLAYKDNCLKIEELYLHALPPEAPAQPIASWQEPVAKVISANDGPNSNPVVVWIVNFLGRTSNIKEGDWLFTRPAPAQEPLSDDQIANACKHLLCVHPNAQTTLDIARAIEAEHNIKENP